MVELRFQRRTAQVRRKHAGHADQFAGRVVVAQPVAAPRHVKPRLQPLRRSFALQPLQRLPLSGRLAEAIACATGLVEPGQRRDQTDIARTLPEEFFVDGRRLGILSQRRVSLCEAFVELPLLFVGECVPPFVEALRNRQLQASHGPFVLKADLLGRRAETAQHVQQPIRMRCLQSLDDRLCLLQPSLGGQTEHPQLSRSGHPRAIRLIGV